MGRVELTVLHHFSHGHPLQLVPFTQAQQPLLKTQCCGPPSSANERSSSDPLYACEPCNFYVHKRCLQLPQFITHPSHPPHTLTLLPVCAYADATFSCDACSRTSTGFAYNCTQCSFDLHVYCASMPLQVRHGSHLHPLSLSFACPYPEEGDFNCDLCRGRGGSAWLYRCAPCGFDAHLDCARGIGLSTSVPVQPAVGPRPAAPVQSVQPMVGPRPVAVVPIQSARPYPPAAYQVGPRPAATIQSTGPFASWPYMSVRPAGPRPMMPGPPQGPYMGASGQPMVGPRPIIPSPPQAAQAPPVRWNQPGVRMAGQGWPSQPNVVPTLQFTFGNSGGGQTQGGVGQNGNPDSQGQGGNTDDGGAHEVQNGDSGIQGQWENNGGNDGEAGGQYCNFDEDDGAQCEAQAEFYCSIDNEEGQGFSCDFVCDS